MKQGDFLVHPETQLGGFEEKEEPHWGPEEVESLFFNPSENDASQGQEGCTQEVYEKGHPRQAHGFWTSKVPEIQDQLPEKEAKVGGS